MRLSEPLYISVCFKIYNDYAILVITDMAMKVVDRSTLFSIIASASIRTHTYLNHAILGKQPFMCNCVESTYLNNILKFVKFILASIRVLVFHLFLRNIC